MKNKQIIIILCLKDAVLTGSGIGYIFLALTFIKFINFMYNFQY